MRHTTGEARTKSETTFSNGPLHTDVLVQTDQQKLSYTSPVRTQDVVRKTSRKQWMIGMNGER